MTDTPETPPAARVAIQKVQLMTPDGPLRGQVQVDTGPMRLKDLVSTAQELTSVMGDRAIRRSEKLGFKLSCAAGCGACCRQMVPVSVPEAYALADLLDGLDPIARAGVMGRFEKIETHLEKQNMIEPLLDTTLASDPAKALNRTYFAMQMPCPFLVDESCSIHADRPVACRDYNVTSPAARCRDPWTFNVDVIPMPLPLSVALARTTAEVTGGEPVLIPLTLVPRWVAAHPEWRTLTWPGLELFQKFMAHAGGPPPDRKAEGENAEPAPPAGDTGSSEPNAGDGA